MTETLSDKRVHVRTWTFGDKSKKYPYSMLREVDVKEFIKKLTPQLFHKIYEEEADKTGWETQRKCRVEFDDLPEQNQLTMIRTLGKIKKIIFGDNLI